MRQSQDGFWHVRHLHPGLARGDEPLDFGTEYFEVYFARVIAEIDRQLEDPSCPKDAIPKLIWLKAELEDSKGDWGNDFQLRPR